MIINSILDTDWYKITMAQVVYFHFPDWQVKYKFVNRDKKNKFSKEFVKELRNQINSLSIITLDCIEIDWLKEQEVIYPEFLEWLKKYKFNPQEVKISLTDDNDLDISIEGTWLRTIFWEVPLLAIISELYYDINKCVLDEEKFDNLCNIKAKTTEKFKLAIADFGTRRRFSFTTQEILLNNMDINNSLFLGTSNAYFAMMYDIKVVGTYAHEAPMAMQTVSLTNGDYIWYNLWRNIYGKKYSVALSDTLTTDYFLKNMPILEMKLMDGIRQDSGDPIEIGNKIINRWKELNIDPKLKTIVFSDDLNLVKAKLISDTFKDTTNTIFGIGTYLTNQCGYQPLNMVIKLDEVNNKKVVKISDTINKHTGNKAVIEEILEIINNGKGV
jgi:nicotinate phosphoribosyltransferase